MSAAIFWPPSEEFDDEAELPLADESALMVEFALLSPVELPEAIEFDESDACIPLAALPVLAIDPTSLLSWASSSAQLAKAPFAAKAAAERVRDAARILRRFIGVTSH
ncbi:MAG: hypothetical protein KAG89_04760 [Fulvimarina manganoxydans]|uniref:hypothetical protein n=1 Tax=Fulvimarina manganoxydans TaxID=937218 RepID=UPI002354F710|nr:hypothetical protein [Fulvimarina manganoxydans]MCK5931463.1 hypothetical protein [Fulvimarina manganoxydans]